MYYYYDVLLNFGEEEKIYEFYEWEEKDSMEFVKKIPIFRISSDCLKDNLKYKTKFSSSLLLQIKDKTILKSSTKTCEYTFLISDTKNALALELNEGGVVISRSKLLPGDELNLSEVMFTMKESTLQYEKLAKYKSNKEIRQIREIKKLIQCEIDSLYEEKNESKLKYLYLEWFDKNNENIDDIYKEMTHALQKEYSTNLKRVYDFIKLSYNQIH